MVKSTPFIRGAFFWVFNAIVQAIWQLMQGLTKIKKVRD